MTLAYITHPDCRLHDWLPALAAFRPEMLFVSAGFDAHREDDMAMLSIACARPERRGAPPSSRRSLVGAGHDYCVI